MTSACNLAGLWSSKSKRRLAARHFVEERT